MKSKEKVNSLLFKAIFCTVVAFLLVIVFTPIGEHSVKLKEYCDRVAIYEQTKNTNDVRGHRDFDDDMECSDE